MDSAGSDPDVRRNPCLLGRSCAWSFLRLAFCAIPTSTSNESALAALGECAYTIQVAGLRPIDHSLFHAPQARSPAILREERPAHIRPPVRVFLKGPLRRGLAEVGMMDKAKAADA